MRAIARFRLASLTAALTAAFALTSVAAGVSLANAACADGNLEPDEECDDGNMVDGDGCEATCTATTCTSGLTIDGADLVIGGYYTGKLTLRFKGRLPFGPGQPPGYDPATTGAQVRFNALTQVPPNSATTCDAQHDGWRGTGSKRTYRNRSTAIDPPACTAGSAHGLTELSFSQNARSGSTTVLAKAKDFAFPHGAPIEVVVGLDTDPAHCGRLVFSPEQCEVVGRVSAQINKIRCRAN